MTLQTFLQGVGALTAIWLGFLVATMGVWAGLKASVWAFGPLQINIGSIHITVRDR